LAGGSTGRDAPLKAERTGTPPPIREEQVIAGVRVSGGTTEQDISIVEAAMS
jgi:uncharacterized protein GlcG (DUF336 family)